MTNMVSSEVATAHHARVDAAISKKTSETEGSMPADRIANENSEITGERTYVLWVLPLLLLMGIWLWLVFSSGGGGIGDWAFPALALGVVGMVSASLVVYPRRPRQLSLLVLTLLAGYALWVLASSLWAGSSGSAWAGTARTCSYLLVLALALAYFTSPAVITAFKYLLMAATLALLVVCLWRLWTAFDPAPLFPANRFAFPLEHPNSAAALFLMPFWPLMWLAAGPGERAPLRGVALGLATGLVGLALMTQSRGAAWSLGITLVLLFLLSPGRLRLLFYLVVPGLLMVYAFPQLNRYWLEGAAVVPGGVAARALTVAALAAGFIGMILALLEKWVKVTGRMKAIFGFMVLAACAAGLVYGAMTFTRDAGGPVAWFENTWRHMAAEPAAEPTAEPPPGAPSVLPGTEDGALALPPADEPAAAFTRSDAWHAAWLQLQDRLVLGAGADNFASGTAAVGTQGAPGNAFRWQAGSLVLEVLSETGIIGAVLAFAAVVLAVGGIMWPRTVAGWRGIKRVWDHERLRGPASRWGREPLDYGWEMALVGGMAYWFVHANLESLWRTPAVTIPVLLMLAAALGATDIRARTMWPRLSRWLRHMPGRQPPTMPVGTASAAAVQDEVDSAADDAATGMTSDAADGTAGLGPRAAGDAGMAAPPAEGMVHSTGRTSKKRQHLPRGRLNPEGPLSVAFRIGVLVLSAAVLILTASSYLLELV